MNNFLTNSNFKKWDTAPTFLMPHNNDTTPDIILYTSNIENNILNVEETPDLGSDHLAFKISIDLQKNTQHKDILRYNFHKTNIKKVNENMLAYLQNAESKEIDRQGISEF